VAVPCPGIVDGLGYAVISSGIEQREHVETQKIQTPLIDDIDGGKAEATVRFGLDGASYEIDLSMARVAELRGVLARFIAGGGKISGTVNVAHSLGDGQVGAAVPAVVCGGVSRQGVDSPGERDRRKVSELHESGDGGIVGCDCSRLLSSILLNLMP
jgi:hypothetical protein